MKKQMSLVVWLLVIAIALPSDAISQSKKKLNKVMQSWMDTPKKDLYLSWGPPTRVTSDGNGGEILIYSKRTYARYNIMNSETVIDYYLHQMFYANNIGIIYAWRWERNNNPPERMDVNLYIK